MDSDRITTEFLRYRAFCKYITGVHSQRGRIRDIFFAALQTGEVSVGNKTVTSCVRARRRRSRHDLDLVVCTVIRCMCFFAFPAHILGPGRAWWRLKNNSNTYDSISVTGMDRKPWCRCSKERGGTAAVIGYVVGAPQVRTRNEFGARVRFHGFFPVLFCAGRLRDGFYYVSLLSPRIAPL